MAYGVSDILALLTLECPVAEEAGEWHLRGTTSR
jgi:hypothetical protein